MTVWHENQADGLTIVGISGRLDQLLTPQLESELRQLIDDGRLHLLVDMNAVTYINSGGLRTLVSAWRTARQQEGNLALCGLTQRVREIFTMVGFDKVFQIYDSCDQARELLGSSR